MKLVSPKLEVVVLKSMASGDSRLSSWLFPRLSKDSFSFEPAQDFYRRITFLTAKNGEIPYWDDLLEDMTIAEDAREEMAQHSGRLIETKAQAVRVLEKLDEYRRVRMLFHASRQIATSLKSDKVDIELLVENLSEYVSKARGGNRSIDDSMMHYGGKHFDKKALIEVLRNSKFEFIPTGIRAFDSENQGVPRGSAFVIAGPTGSGKSAIALNLAKNQALSGAKIAFVGLEMSRLETNRRLYALLTEIPLSKINRAQDLTREERRTIIQTIKEFHERVNRNGGRLTIICPDDDLKIEDIDSALKGRGYDNKIIDYMGLLAGMDGDDQWRKLGAAARFAKRATAADNSIYTLLGQLSEEGELRYSKAVQEHASLMWKWARPDESNIITIKQPKARNLKNFDFMVELKYHIMKVVDVDVSKIAEKQRDQPVRATQRGKKLMKAPAKQDGYQL